MSDREAFEGWAREHIKSAGLISSPRDFRLDALGVYESATLQQLWECWQVGFAAGEASGRIDHAIESDRMQE